MTFDLDLWPDRSQNLINWSPDNKQSHQISCDLVQYFLSFANNTHTINKYTAIKTYGWVRGSLTQSVYEHCILYMMPIFYLNESKWGVTNTQWLFQRHVDPSADFPQEIESKCIAMWRYTLVLPVEAWHGVQAWYYTLTQKHSGLKMEHRNTWKQILYYTAGFFIKLFI